MQDFLNKLYSYEYFGTYLMISIVVLILLFIIILFFGKKDQKNREIEATKKLQQINDQNAFKEENNATNVEVKAPDENTLGSVAPTNTPNLENDTIIVPNIDTLATENNNVVNTTPDEIPEPVIPTTDATVNNIPTENVVNNESVNIPVQPVVNETQVESVQVPPVMPSEPVVPDVNNNVVNEQPTINQDILVPNVETAPILDRVEERPLVFEQPEVTPVVPQFDNVNTEVPVFNFDEIIKGVEETKKEQTEVKDSYEAPKMPMPEVFSSVYAPQKEEVKEEQPKEEPVSVPSSDELDIELPTLKKEVVKEEENIDMPALNDLSGETYNIK